MDGPPRRQGRPEEELFFRPDVSSPQTATTTDDTPTVGPLRIAKHSPASSPQPASSAEAFRPPPFKPFPPVSSPPPTGPLPYPDDRPRRTYSPPVIPLSNPPPGKPSYGPRPDKERTPTPPDEGRGRGSSITSGRPRFDGNDPNRPTVSGYGYAPTRTGDSPVQPSKLAERRGTFPKPLPDSPGPETPDKDGLFQRYPAPIDTGRRPSQPASVAVPAPLSAPKPPTAGEINANPFPEYHQQYWPPPSGGGPASTTLKIPNPGGINRLDSTASTATTKAQRGSPPPPETPIVDAPGPGGGIEARYAAAGIAGASTLSSIQSQNAAAAQRVNPYAALQQRAQTTSPPLQQQPPRQPWGAVEQPAGFTESPPRQRPPTAPLPSTNAASIPPIGSPTSSAGGLAGRVSPPRIITSPTAPTPLAGRLASEHPIEHDMSRLGMNEEPPPSYASISHPVPGGPTTAQGYPNEKNQQFGAAAAGGAAAGGLAAAAAANAANAAPGPALGPAPGPSSGPPQHVGVTLSDPNLQHHPAFANDPRQQPGMVGGGPSPQPGSVGTPDPAAGPSAPPGAGPASPPPLPEGWIAHIDPSSGQYYYIHLPSQSTQWEFPKGPTPLNLNEPMSPIGGTFNPLTPSVTSFASKPGLASPGFPPQTATYHEGMMGMAGLASPTGMGFTGPPPSAGVDIYKVAPTNNVYFGPYLRYTNMDIERGLWLGSILLVTDAPHPPTIHIHQSVDLSPNPRQLKANPIYTHQRWIFYRYDIDLRMEDEHSAKWTYAITSHLGCTRYEFLVAGRHETSWRFIAHSGNDFALSVNANERSKLGGVGFMWRDILQKHSECGGFHAQLGLGGQIYADRMWKEIPLLKQWTGTSGKDNRKNAQWTAKHEEDVTNAYFHYYTSHFDQPHLREAFAQIPHVLNLDDHDIFDGFGSYPEYMQFSNMFKNIGRIGMEMYLLFQHHTTLEILRNVSSDQDIFTVTGTGWHFVKYLGPAVVVVGPDCRSERNPHQVMAGPTYQGIFPKVALLPPSVQHCIWMIPVPLIYPRMESFEHLASTMATGKKAVTGTFNLLGKTVGTVAGVVGAKGVVGDGFNSVKKAVGKSGLMSGILSPFGEIDVLDELRDQWTHESKDLERTYLIRTLQGIAHNKSLRMTFLSGGVDCCGAGLVHDPSRPQDHKTMYQIISSAVVNAPTSGYVIRLLHNNKPLYVPANGHRSSHQPTDTKEDMMEIFTQDVNGTAREHKKLMGRRNYVACVIFDPEVVNGTFGQAVPGHGGGGKLSLAVDFMVQNEGAYGSPMKYGPVIVPSLEYGR